MPVTAIGAAPETRVSGKLVVTVSEVRVRSTEPPWLITDRPPVSAVGRLPE